MATKDGPPYVTDMTPGTWSLQQERGAMLRRYRAWAKTTQICQAKNFTGPQVFWRSIKGLLNNEVFPGQRLFRRTAAARYVLWPTRQEMRKGFDRLIEGALLSRDRIRPIPNSGPITLVKRLFFQPRQRDGVY